MPSPRCGASGGLGLNSLKPGMHATRSTDPRPPVPDRASGYQWVKGGYENRPVLAPSIAFSEGALLSTVEDLARWDSALHSSRILSQASRELMWTPVAAGDRTPAALDDGFGWFVVPAVIGFLATRSSSTPAATRSPPSSRPTGASPRSTGGDLT